MLAAFPLISQSPLNWHTFWRKVAAASAKSFQLCPTLCNPKDNGPPGSSVPGILQPEYWSGLPFPSPVHACMLSCFSHVRLFATLWIVAHQAPPSMEFPRQEYWSGLPFPSPVHACMLSRFSCVQLCATPWTATHQAPLSTGFSRQEYWSGLPFPSLRDWMRYGLKFWSNLSPILFSKMSANELFF